MTADWTMALKLVQKPKNVALSRMLDALGLDTA